MENLILATIFASFLITYLIIPSWIKNAKVNNMVSKDMHKISEEKVAEGGGVAVISGITIGILFYIALKTFYFGSNGETIFIFALLCTILISALVGLIDDSLGWKKGLSRKTRILIIAFAAVPLMVVNAGISSMSFPFLGEINFGILYPLIIIPLGIIGATTTFNFLAGYNGLESSQGIILLTGLSIATYITGNRWLSVIALYAVFSLLAFYIFNKCPAKIFPGDVLTYPIGALIATIAILGNIEKIALFFFIPYIIETCLKVRGKLEKESFAKINRNGNLDLPYKKIYGLEHAAVYIIKKIKKNQVKEKEVVYIINGFQIAVIILGLIVLL